jgi:two-component system nitrogen regulation sensor histidine kinase GlnL
LTGASISLRDLAIRIGGRELRLDCRATLLEDGSGVLLELTDLSRDRTIRHEADRQAQQRVSRQIVRQLAHEVKNPLGGMRGAAQLLERKLPSEELKRYTNIIIVEADRLAAMVDSALKVGGRRHATEINIHQITEHVAQLLVAEAPPSIEILRDYDPSLPPLHIDRDQIVQAVLNIARNALQALGSRGRIVVRTRALPNFTLGGVQHRLVVSTDIEDNGPGIPQELLETVFYPLVTSKNSGSGIGLTIAQELVSSNGGLIEFESRPGRTVFRVRLLVQNASAARNA